MKRIPANPPIKRSYTKLLERELTRLVARGELSIDTLDPRLRPYVRHAAGRSAAA